MEKNGIFQRLQPQKDKEFLAKVTELEIELKRIKTYDLHIQRVLNLEKELLLQKSQDSQKRKESSFELPNVKLQSAEKRIAQLEAQVSRLSSLVNECFKKIQQLSNETSEIRKSEQSNKEKPSIIMQEIKVEKMYVDKYELINNIAQLGVKDLSGKLNIGTSYDKGIFPSEKDQTNEDPTSDQENQEGKS
jgi:hypothetical protein